MGETCILQRKLGILCVVRGNAPGEDLAAISATYYSLPLFKKLNPSGDCRYHLLQTLEKMGVPLFHPALVQGDVARNRIPGYG